MKRYVIKKVILIAGIIIAAIILNIISGYLAVPASQVNVDASFDVMAGDSTTVAGIATHNAAGGALAIGRIVSIVVIVILGFIFIADIAMDIRKYTKGLRKAEEDQK